MEKSQILQNFQRQIRGKISQFRGIYAGILGANFAEKQSVKNGQFCGKVLGKLLLSLRQGSFLESGIF